jgi:uncharacterized membrane protein
MITLLRREFTVDRPIEKVWRHLARVEQWPKWAKHIRQVEVHPPGELAPTSTGLIHLRNGFNPKFTMTEFNPYVNWKWVGGFLWLTVHYDHRFEERKRAQTKLTWVVEARGLGVSVFGRIFAKIYSKNLDRAIPLLIEQMNASSG